MAVKHTHERRKKKKKRNRSSDGSYSSCQQRNHSLSHILQRGAHTIPAAATANPSKNKEKKHTGDTQKHRNNSQVPFKLQLLTVWSFGDDVPQLEGDRWMRGGREGGRGVGGGGGGQVRPPEVSSNFASALIRPSAPRVKRQRCAARVLVAEMTAHLLSYIVQKAEGRQ